MRNLSFLLLLLFSHPIWAQDTLIGNMHAVINPDGTISYYLKIGPEVLEKVNAETFNKPTITQLVGGNESSPKVFQIVGAKNEIAGYFVASASSGKAEPVAVAIEKGYKAKAVSFESLPEQFSQVYKFTDQKGNVGGAWLPSDQDRGVSVLGNLIPTDWSTSKVSATSRTTLASSSSIPVPEADLIESLRESMLQQAISLACKSKVIPKEIAVAASLAASVGFIVGGEGTISFEATWETAQLCKP